MKNVDKEIIEGFEEQERERELPSPFHVDVFGVVIDTRNIKTSKRISPYQAKFCLEYVRHNNVTTAAKKAGINLKGGYPYKLFAKPHIKEYINGLTALANGKIEYEAEHIVKDLLTIKETAINKGKLDTAIRCIELLGKTKNMWKDGDNTTNIEKAVIILPPQNNMNLNKFLDTSQQNQITDKSN